MYYRPQRSCEGYVFTGVCLPTGGVLSQHALQQVSGGVPGPGQLPCSLGRGVPGGLLWGGVCSQGAGPGGAGIPACTVADPPTGMHSCYLGGPSHGIMTQNFYTKQVGVKCPRVAGV